MNAELNTSKSRLLFLGLILLCGFVVCNCGADGTGSSNGVRGSVKEQGRDWKKFIEECISKVEKSDAVFYRRGERVTGKEVAQQMRQYLRHLVRNKIIPDPFGWNAGVVLAVITTHEGIARDGLTGPPEPMEIEVGGRRMKLYDWLKREFGIEMLPGDEPGHEVEPYLYETDITPELLAQWERYIDKCIETVREAKDVTFMLGERVFPPAELAAIMEGNRSNALRRLRIPEITESMKDDYDDIWILLPLFHVPLPKPESFADKKEYEKEMFFLGTHPLEVKKQNGKRDYVVSWLKERCGKPPPVPTLKKKRR
jgi:hypothetical protein